MVLNKKIIIFLVIVLLIVLGYLLFSNLLVTGETVLSPEYQVYGEGLLVKK
tara:strand:+ start:9835 stop:9987 length:153 start_codon:yes stop_codon:yes gene_type:complete